MPEGQISLRERLLSGGAWALAGKILTAITVLAINSLLTRLLTPAEMGDYFLTLSLVGFSSIVAQSGLAVTIVRLVAESLATNNPGRARQAIIWAIKIMLASTLIIAVILALGVGNLVSENVFHSPAIGSIMHIAALWIAMLVFQAIFAEIFRGFHDIRLATILGGLSTSIFTALIFLALWLTRRQSDLGEIVAVSTVAVMGTVLLSGLLLGKRVTALPAGNREISLQEVLAISWPLWITSLTLFALTQADLWVLGLFRNQSDVAIYGVAVRLVAFVAMPLLIVNAVIQPVISELYSKGKMAEMERVMRATGTMVALPAFAVLGLFFLFGDTILGYFFGDFYRGAGLALLILSTGQLINAWAGSCGLVLMLTGNQVLMMKISALSGLFVVVGSLLLVDKYGSTGVATAAALGMILQNILMLLSVRKKLHLWTHADYAYAIAMIRKML